MVQRAPSAVHDDGDHALEGGVREIRERTAQRRAGQQRLQREDGRGREEVDRPEGEGRRARERGGGEARGSRIVSDAGPLATGVWSGL